MSTKTTFKRVALVAVASLGFGVLTAVTPANAALLSTTAAPDALSMTTPTVTARVGDAVSSTFSASFGEAGDGTLFAGAQISLTKPTGSTVTLTDKNGNATADDPIAQTTGAANMTTTVENDSANDKTMFKFVMANALAAADTNVAGTVGFTPDRPGTYVVTITALTDGAGSAATANTALTTSFTVTVRSLAYTTGDATAAAPYNTGTGVAGVANTVTVTAHSTQTASQKALVTVSGSGATIQSASNSTVSTDLLSTVVNAAASSSIVIKTPTAGTITVSLFNETAAGSGLYSTTASNTVTITVNAAASNGVYSYATAFISATQGSAPTADDATAISASSTAAARARIAVRQYDNLDTLLVAAQTKAITVSISGVGQLAAANSGATGNYLAVAAAAGTNSGPNDFYVYSDGRSGVGTITIAVNGVTVATKTVTFYGSVASYVVSTKNAVLSVGSSADTQVLTVQALDANGVAVPSATVHVSSGTTSVATVDSATVTTSAAGAAADIGINGVAKGSAVITVGNAATSPTVSATATISVVAAGIASVALSFDKAEYNPGEKATITITAKNADGALVGDEAYATLFATGGISASSSLTTDLTAVSVTTVNGVKTYSVFMPLAAGPVSISATLGASVATAIQATAVTASATVLTNGVAEAAADAAAEATDAANAATDAANAAAEAADAATAAAQDAADAVAALSTQVSEMVNALKKQITALTNLVIKIQKKVKA
jgi:hypothetical protein